MAEILHHLGCKKLMWFFASVAAKYTEGNWIIMEFYKGNSPEKYWKDISRDVWGVNLWDEQGTQSLNINKSWIDYHIWPAPVRISVYFFKLRPGFNLDFLGEAEYFQSDQSIYT